MAKRKRAPSRPRRPKPARARSPIPAKQWRLPAGYHADGRPASLTRVVDPKTPTIDGDRLSAGQRAALAALRIGRQKAFRVGVLGNGVVTKRRALKEVKAGTPLGLALVDIEHRAIRLMREWAERHPPTPPRKLRKARRARKVRKAPKARAKKR